MKPISTAELSNRLKQLQLIRLPCLVLIVLLAGINLRTAYTEQQLVVTETAPIIDSLNNLRFAALRTVSSIAEYGLLEQLNTASTESKSQEDDLINEGSRLLKSSLNRYRDLMVNRYTDDHPGAERLYYEGSLLWRYTINLRQAVDNKQQDDLELFDTKELLEESERRFLALSEKLLSAEQKTLAQHHQRQQQALSQLAFILGTGAFVLLILEYAIFRLRRRL